MTYEERCMTPAERDLWMAELKLSEAEHDAAPEHEIALLRADVRRCEAAVGDER